MAALRTGSEYLRSLDDGRQVFLDPFRGRCNICHTPAAHVSAGV